jgi:hypothetical protein
MGMSGQCHAPAALYPREKEPVPIVEEAGWIPEPVWRQRLEEKSLVSAGDRTPVVRSAARQYGDWATAAPSVDVRVLFWYSLYAAEELCLYRSYVNSWVRSEENIRSLSSHINTKPSSGSGNNRIMQMFWIVALIGCWSKEQGHDCFFCVEDWNP